VANRYWVGGTGTWSTASTTNWSTASGGASGASVPTAADSVFFDQAGTYTVTMTGALTCLDFTVSAGTVTFATGTGPSLAISGSMTLIAGTLWNTTAGITFNATTSGKTITTNGVNLANSTINFNGAGGVWTLGSALSTITSGINLLAGTLDTSASNYAISVSSFVASGSATAQLNLNGSTMTLTSTSTAFSITNSSFTLNAGTSQITLSAVASGTLAFAGFGKTFYNVSFTGALTIAGFISITGANTFNNLSFTAPSLAVIRTVTFFANQTINGTMTGSGATQIRRIFYNSDNLGTARSLTLAGATTLTNCDFRDITAVTNAITATGGGDCGGNTNITGFPAAKTVYWNLAGAQSWSATGWATSSGGTPALANFPLAQDTAVFDNTGSVTGTITINQSWNIGTVDMSGRTTAMTLATGTTTPLIYGSWLNGTGTTLSGTGLITFTGRGNTQQIFGNGKNFTQPISITNIGGTAQLTSALTLGSTLTFYLTNGTLDLQSYTLTTGLFSSNNSNTRTIAFGTGNITVNGTGTVFDLTTITNMTTTGTQVVNVSNATATATSIFPGSLSEANSISFNFTTGTYTLTHQVGNVRNFNFTGFSGTVSNISKTIYGNLTLSSSATYTAGAAAWTFAGTSGSKAITSNGKTMDFPLTFDGTGSSWALQDALTMGSTRLLDHYNGTIDLNGKTLTTYSYRILNGTKNITFNGGTFVCAGTGSTFFNTTPAGFTTTAGTGVGTISMTAATSKTFVGGGSTFNCTLNQGGAGALTISGSNTFSNITNTTQPATITFTASTTNTFTSFSLSGTAGNLITINSTSAGTRATVSKASGTVSADYLSIKDSAAAGGATWYAGANSTNVSNNTGWIFTAPPSGNTSNFFTFLTN